MNCFKIKSMLDNYDYIDEQYIPIKISYKLKSIVIFMERLCLIETKPRGSESQDIQKTIGDYQDIITKYFKFNSNNILTNSFRNQINWNYPIKHRIKNPNIKIINNYSNKVFPYSKSFDDDIVEIL
jgi:hypothetical protein